MNSKIIDTNNLLPFNNLKFLQKQAKLSTHDIEVNTGIPERTLSSIINSQTLMSQNPFYYFELEKVFNCHFLKLFFNNGRQLLDYVFKTCNQLIHDLNTLDLNHYYQNNINECSVSFIVNNILSKLQNYGDNVKILSQYLITTNYIFTDNSDNLYNNWVNNLNNLKAIQQRQILSIPNQSKIINYISFALTQQMQWIQKITAKVNIGNLDLPAFKYNCIYLKAQKMCDGKEYNLISKKQSSIIFTNISFQIIYDLLSDLDNL